MKKLLIISCLMFLTAACLKEKVTPIEKHKGVGYVITSRHVQFPGDNIDLQLKNKDTIFWITVLEFDGKDLKVGDSIK